MDPLMTYGMIEGTPQAVNGDVTPAPVFQIPDISERDRLARKLVDDNNRKKRQQHSFTRMSTASRGSTPTSRLETMSPAAQRLARKFTGDSTSLNSALRTNYGSTSSAKHLGARLTPRVTPRVTPKNTPRVTPKTSRQATPASVISSHANGDVSLTDDLL